MAEVPGLLAVGDLPQIAGRIALRPFLLRVQMSGPYDWTVPPTWPIFGSDGLRASEAKPH